MIRDTRAYVALNVVGALLALFLLANWAINPPSHPVFPAWLLIGLCALLFAGFVYQIIMRLTGRSVPSAPRNVTDRQLWIMKTILIAALVVIAFVVVMIFVPPHHP